MLNVNALIWLIETEQVVVEDWDFWYDIEDRDRYGGSDKIRICIEKPNDPKHVFRWKFVDKKSGAVFEVSREDRKAIVKAVKSALKGHKKEINLPSLVAVNNKYEEDIKRRYKEIMQ